MSSKLLKRQINQLHGEEGLAGPASKGVAKKTGVTKRRAEKAAKQAARSKPATKEEAARRNTAYFQQTQVVQAATQELMSQVRLERGPRGSGTTHAALRRRNEALRRRRCRCTHLPPPTAARPPHPSQLLGLPAPANAAGNDSDDDVFDI